MKMGKFWSFDFRFDPWRPLNWDNNNSICFLSVTVTYSIWFNVYRKFSNKRRLRISDALKVVNSALIWYIVIWFPAGNHMTMFETRTLSIIKISWYFQLELLAHLALKNFLNDDNAFEVVYTLLTSRGSIPNFRLILPR